MLSEIPMGRKAGFSPDGRPPALKVTVRLWSLAPELAFAVCVGWKLDLGKRVFVLFRGCWHVAMCAFWPGGWQDVKGGSCCPSASEVSFPCFAGQGAGVLLGQRALRCIDKWSWRHGHWLTICPPVVIAHCYVTNSLSPLLLTS